MGRSRPIAVLLLTAALAACGGGIDRKTESAGCVTRYDPGKDYFPVKQKLRYATGFTLAYAKNYQVLTVQPPGAKPEKFALVRCGTPAPKLAGATVVETPVHTMYSASTTHLPFITGLGVLDRLKGVASAGQIASPQVRARVRSGAITEYAKEQQIDVEKVLGARPDVLVTAGIEATEYGALRKAGIKVVPDDDWLEPTALGRAEWIKLFAALTGTEATAARAFDTVAAAYTALARRARAARPVTVLPGQMFQGQWAIPNGGSYIAGLIKDAGGTYPWAGTKGSGSRTLDLEAVLGRAKNARVWLATENTWRSLGDVRRADPRYAEFAAFGSDAVWSANKVIGPGGGDDFYERGVARPDLVLADMVAILHPELLPRHTFAFYQRLAR